jgi:methylated-DNA-[protein]-cysteine S-methyltransferase
MGQELRYVTFDTDMGWTGVLCSARGVIRATLPQSSPQEALKRLGDRVKEASWSPESFSDLIERLRSYLSGHKVAFPDRLDLTGATRFQCAVWEAARLIPYGETRSYGWVAGQIGKAGSARAVGQAMGRNPALIIIPCHRVIASDGRLGGFSNGLEKKKRLLRLEGISITE